MTKLRPRGDRVVLERIVPEQKSAGGILLPDGAGQNMLSPQARVVAVGPGRIDKDGVRVPIDLNPGDIVMLGRFSVPDTKIDDKTYLILSEADISAVVED